MLFSTNRKRFRDLSEQEIIALAISSEEDDARIYRGYAETLRAEYPDSAAIFDGMAAEEDMHRKRLIDLHAARIGVDQQPAGPGCHPAPGHVHNNGSDCGDSTKTVLSRQACSERPVRGSDPEFPGRRCKTCQT